MHQFFNLNDGTQHGVMKYGGWQWVRDGLKRNVGQTIAFYRRNPMAVRSNHFLVRLLQSITVPLSQNLERYYINVDLLALNISMGLKMTSSISGGQIFDGVFYGPGCPEVLLAHDSEFDFQEAHRDWMNLAPVRVLRTPRSDFGLNLPDGTASGTETGIAVISVNIPMLAVQYRAFRQHEHEQAGGDSEKSIMHFLHMYVLPNMLWSQTDQVVFNCLDRLSRKLPLGESVRRHSFAMPASYGERTTELMELVLGDVRRANRGFDAMLQMIPSIYAESMREAMRLPMVTQTRQVVWALTLARLPMLSFLFRESIEGAGTRNRNEVNAIERAALAFQRGQGMRQYLPADLYNRVQQEIDEIIQLPETRSKEVS